jgi:hypothetical protein
VMQMYDRPASRAAIAIVSMSWRPSDAVVCMCTSPRRSSSVRAFRPSRRRFRLVPHAASIVRGKPSAA